MNAPSSQPVRRWYSVSVETLRGLGYLLAVVVLSLGGWWGYQYWQTESLDDRAAEVIAEAGEYLGRLPQTELRRLYAPRFERAVTAYNDARRRFEEGDYAGALAQGRVSRDHLEDLAASLGNRERSGAAQVITVQGEVELRRGGESSWRPVRKGMILDTGDTVRTGSEGSVELATRDESVLTIRSDTQVRIPAAAVTGAGGQAVDMEYGWVDLATSDRGGRVRTPDADAEVEGATEGFVAVEQGDGKRRFGAYRGAMKVSATDGETRQLGELEQVTQERGALSQPTRLPPAPTLSGPAEHSNINWSRGGETDRLRLEWEPVPGASAYALQVSEDYLFVDNVVEDERRTRTYATLGIRDQGSFLWHVAALAEDGSRGPWSEARSFRVSAVSGRDPGEDRAPPPVQIDELTRFGNLYMVRGRTEPGARVTVNGENAKVEPDGTFTRTIQFAQTGWVDVEVRARDAWGNEDSVTKPVHVEGP